MTTSHRAVRSETYDLTPRESGPSEHVTVHYGRFYLRDNQPIEFPYTYIRSSENKEKLFPNASLGYFMQQQSMHPKDFNEAAIVLALMNSAHRKPEDFETNPNTAFIADTSKEDRRCWVEATKIR